jgi:hypothetical protein
MPSKKSFSYIKTAVDKNNHQPQLLQKDFRNVECSNNNIEIII